MTERRRIAGRLIVFALACIGLLAFAQVGSAEETVQGQQSSDGSSATTGSADGTNRAEISGGPSASGSDGASAAQTGSNSGSVDQSASADTGDPVAGAQVTGAVADDVTVQNQNSATNPNAESGTAQATNEVSEGTSLGPVATSESGTAQATQNGSNSLEVVQASDAGTGDAVAGSQVTGIAGGGEHVVQNQNSSLCEEEFVGVNTCALSGFANARNGAFELNLGPLASAPDGAEASQIGDNDAVFVQSAVGSSGDAPSGSQVTGIVGGSATVQNQNTSEFVGDFDAARSGPVVAFNGVAGVTLGPAATSDADAMATQNGSNALGGVQDLDVSSGDALSGSQVTGWIGDEAGFLTVQNQQASEGDRAFSGSTEGSNSFGQQTFAVGLLGNVNVGPYANGSGATSASQIGDNEVAAEQRMTVGTGDALAGGQVTGAVGGDDSVVTVQNQNTATDVFAVSGSVFAGIDSIGAFGNTFAVIVGPQAYAFGPAPTSQASQTGDNAVALGQTLDASTGDAVAGGQVTGVVAGDDSDVTVQNQNTATDATALSGGYGTNPVVFGDPEPTAPIGFGAGNLGDATLGPQSYAGDFQVADESAQTGQIGDNTAVASQSAVVATGDAIAGGQVTGAVAGDGSTVTVQDTNTVTGAEARSGDAVIGTGLIRLPGENGFVPAGGLNQLGLFPGPQAYAGNGATETAEVSQIGDNTVDAVQTATVTTGDAVAGAQVTGAVTGDGGEIVVQGQNTADEVRGVSGSLRGGGLGPPPSTGDPDPLVNGVASGVNALFVTAGPYAYTGGGTVDVAQGSQIGDNAVAVSQDVVAATGDAVAGAQVTGAVAGDGSEVTVQTQNTAESTNALSGDVRPGGLIPDAASPSQVGGELNILIAGVGPTVYAGAGQETALASQNGSNSVDIAQSADAASGDAVSGAQVTGVVTGTGSTVEVQAQNACPSTDGPSCFAFSGSVFATNVVELEHVGPEAETGVPTDGDVVEASQIGSNDVVVDQSVVASGGDAVAGSQVTGVVAGSGSDVTVQNQNTATALAIAGVDSTVAGANVLEVGGIGPVAEVDGGGTAQASQVGDDTLAFTQDVVVSGGDAVAGSQVTGVVGAEDATVQVSNTDGGSFALSGPTFVENVAGGSLGPVAEGTDASAVHDGDTGLDGVQTFSNESGDALSGAQVHGMVGGEETIDQVTVFGDLGGLGAANTA